MVTLNRPKRLNAWNAAMPGEVSRALANLRAEVAPAPARELEGFLIRTLRERVDGPCPRAVHYTIDRKARSTVQPEAAPPPVPRVSAETKAILEHEARSIQDEEVRRGLVEWMCLAMAREGDDG